MQKIKDFCKRHRLLWLTLLVALAAAAVAAWAGFDLGQRVDNQPVYEIVNDDYTRTVVIPATADAATQDDGTTGLYLPVPIKSGQRIYGVRLDLTTHNWAFRHGTLYAALLDADGNAVANGELDCITIKDNTFAAITFDAPYTAPGTADAEEDYDLANPNMTLRLPRLLGRPRALAEGRHAHEDARAQARQVPVHVQRMGRPDDHLRNGAGGKRRLHARGADGGLCQARGRHGGGPSGDPADGRI